MDDSSRVGDVTSSCSITSSDGRDGGSGKASNADGGGGGDAGVAGSSVGKGVAIASVASVASVAETVVAEEVGVGFSADCCSNENRRLKGDVSHFNLCTVDTFNSMAHE